MRNKRVLFFFLLEPLLYHQLSYIRHISNLYSASWGLRGKEFCLKRCGRYFTLQAPRQAPWMANASGWATEHFYLRLSCSAQRDIYCDLNMQSWKTCEHTSAQTSSVDTRLLLNQSALLNQFAAILPIALVRLRQEEISAPQTPGTGPLMILTCSWPPWYFFEDNFLGTAEKKTKQTEKKKKKKSSECDQPPRYRS